MKTTIAVANRLGILISKRSAYAIGSQVRKRVPDEMKSTDQFFPWIAPKMEMESAAQMSQTRRGIFSSFTTRNEVACLNE